MPRFFFPQEYFDDSIVKIKGADARHIMKSLRMKPGELLTVCDMRRSQYQCVIENNSTDQEVILKVISREDATGDPDIKVILYQALAKGDKMDYIVQKAVELGVAEIVPIITDRIISRPDSEALEKKRLRWDKIALEASIQSCRAAPVRVQYAINYDSAIGQIKQADTGFICYEGDCVTPIRTYLSGRNIKNSAFLIGPEGGLSENEVSSAKRLGLPLIGLGSRILRTETASGCVLSVLMYESGNL